MFRRYQVLLGLLAILAISVHGTAIGQQADAAAKPPEMGRYPRFEQLLWSGDGKWLLASGDFNHLAAFSAGDGRMYRMLWLDAHPTALAAVPDSSQVAVGTNQGSVEIWDTNSWKMQRRLQVGTAHNTDAVAVSSHGKLLATCVSGELQVSVWDVASGERVGLLGDGKSGVRSPVFSLDGSQLAGVEAHEYLRVWNLGDQEQLHSLLRVPVGLHRGRLRFTPNGKTLVLVEPGMITFWTPESQQPAKVVLAPESIAPHPQKGMPTSYIAANSSGAMFAGATDLTFDNRLAASITREGTVAIWSVESREIVKTLPAATNATRNTNLIRSLCFSPDSRRLAATSPDGEVIFWEVPPMD